MKFVLLTAKKWHDDLFFKLNQRENEEWMRITDKKFFTEEYLESINPQQIFIPHWSHIIPQSIFENYECIVFHMTDLPYGRGGSPLQNLIVRGHSETVVSAIKVESGIDTGPIYLKKPLSLSGSAYEIFVRSSSIVKNMIAEIIECAIVPIEQSGDVVEFKRRKASDGDIAELDSLEKIYDHIRMLDCHGYPKAFLDIGDFKIEFENANLESKVELTANVRITKK